MRIDDLIARLEKHKAQYGNSLVRFCPDDEKDYRIEDVYPVNIHKAGDPVWVAMLSD